MLAAGIKTELTCRPNMKPTQSTIICTVLVRIEVNGAGLSPVEIYDRTDEVLTSHDCTPGTSAWTILDGLAVTCEYAALSACTHSPLTRVGRFVPYQLSRLVRECGHRPLRVLACLVATHTGFACLP
jgi:hypothetical protein